MVSQLNNNLNAKVPSDVKLIVEGSGANTKYYIQRGADTASKKPLGSSGSFIHVNYPYVASIFGTKTIATKSKPKLIMAALSTVSSGNNYALFSFYCDSTYNNGSTINLFRGTASLIKNITDTSFQLVYNDNAAFADIYYLL